MQHRQQPVHAGVDRGRLGPFGLGYYAHGWKVREHSQILCSVCPCSSEPDQQTVGNHRGRLAAKCRFMLEQIMSHMIRQHDRTEYLLFAKTNRLGILHATPVDYEMSSGRRVCQSVSRSYMRAARSSRSSSNGGARICSPIGKPLRVKPQGMEMPAMPARFAVIV